MSMTEKTPTPHPADDPLVAELLDSPTVRQFRRLQFLRSAAAMLEQAMTILDPNQKAKIEKLCAGVMSIAEDEEETAPVRVIIGESTVWPDDADCYTVENAGPALRSILAGRGVGTKGRIEHYDGDRYNLVEAYMVGEDGSVYLTERRAS